MVTRKTPKMTNTKAMGLFQVKISCPTAMARAAVIIGCRLLYKIFVSYYRILILLKKEIKLIYVKEVIIYLEDKNQEFHLLELFTKMLIYIY